MNEEMEKAMNALSGNGAAGGNAGGDATDWKAKYEEMERKFQSAQVEQGRVKKLAEENAKLQKQLADRTTRRPSDYLSDEERKEIDDAQRGIIDKMVDGRLSDAMAANRDEIEALRAQIAQRDAEREQREQREAAAARQDCAQKIESAFPGFFRDAVLEGGDKHAAWQKYLCFNAASVTTAFKACDFETLSWHIRNFYNTEVGIPPPSGGTGAAAPDPSPTGGGQRVHAETGKIYTAQEYAELEKKAMQLRRMGDFEGYRKLDAELNNILTEGRVKD